MPKQAPNRVKKAYRGDFIQNIGIRQEDTRGYGIFSVHSSYVESCVLLIEKV